MERKTVKSVWWCPKTQTTRPADCSLNLRSSEHDPEASRTREREAVQSCPPYFDLIFKDPSESSYCHLIMIFSTVTAGFRWKEAFASCLSYFRTAGHLITTHFKMRRPPPSSSAPTVGWSHFAFAVDTPRTHAPFSFHLTASHSFPICIILAISSQPLQDAALSGPLLFLQFAFVFYSTCFSIFPFILKYLKFFIIGRKFKELPELTFEPK